MPTEDPRGCILKEEGPRAGLLEGWPSDSISWPIRKEWGLQGFATCEQGRWQSCPRILSLWLSSCSGSGSFEGGSCDVVERMLSLESEDLCVAFGQLW